MTLASFSMPFVNNLRRLFGNRTIALGLFILLVVVLAALLAPWVAPYAPNKLSIVNKLQGPSLAHFFGTDEFGRDIFSRAIYAGRISLLVSLGVVAISTVLGIILGVTAGYFRRLDAPISRLLDAMMSFPDILLRIPAAKTRLHEYPHKFSGGMRQRVMIAMALACKPRLLIADEPTTALDVTIQAEILHLIRELQREENMAVLFITHDMGVVAEVADRTVVMLRGDMVETGATRELFANPTAAYTKSLLASIPRLGTMGDAIAPKRFPQVDPKTGEAEDGSVTKPVSTDLKPILEASDIVVRFDLPNGRIHAVENVSFDLRPGETLALVGESGCGKSTTGRAIMRLLQPSSGSIVIDGQDVTNLGASALRSMRRNAQMIFQDPFASLNPRIRIGAAIAEPMLSHGIMNKKQAKARVAELLQQVGLAPAMADRFPHEFSGGQRQRISIARALALEPKLIVADEAVSALDVSVKAQVANLLMDLQEKHDLAYLFISHDMAVVERISHRVAVMYLGEIVEIGPRQAIFNNPQHPYTRRLIDAVPIPDPDARKLTRPELGEEIKSPLRPLDYVPPQKTYREVSPGHMVQEAPVA